MAEGLATTDGTKLDVAPAAAVEPDAEWSTHMADMARAADDTEHAAPPKKPVEAPADPEAPYGRTADGRPKKGPGGRPPKKKADQPRVAAKAAQGPKKDYTEELTGLVQIGWGALVAFSPADAGAVKVAGPGLVQAWNTLAQESAGVARGIEWLTSGSAYGAVVMATVPLVMQLAANHGRVDHRRVAALGVQDPQMLAEMTAADIQAMQAAAAQAA